MPNEEELNIADDEEIPPSEEEIDQEPGFEFEEEDGDEE